MQKCRWWPGLRPGPCWELTTRPDPLVGPFGDRPGFQSSNYGQLRGLGPQKNFDFVLRNVELLCILDSEAGTCYIIVCIFRIKRHKKITAEVVGGPRMPGEGTYMHCTTYWYATGPRVQPATLPACGLSVCVPEAACLIPSVADCWRIVIISLIYILWLLTIIRQVKYMIVLKVELLWSGNQGLDWRDLHWDLSLFPLFMRYSLQASSIITYCIALRATLSLDLRSPYDTTFAV